MKELKKVAGIKAASFVQDGMIVGLGTGSTAYYFVEELGRRIREEQLHITGVTTSHMTTQQAQSLGIPLKSVDEVDQIDLTVDGADEVDPHFNGIKGGGGALLMEKIVATASKHYIWVVDESKSVSCLGRFPLPVEVVPYGARQLFRQFEKKGYQPSFREKEGQLLVTDMQHVIIDLHLQQIRQPDELACELKQTVGVVEHGLFLHMVDQVIVSASDGVRVMAKEKGK